MTDVAAERIDEHLDTADANPFPPSFDEWNAARLVAGLPPGTWWQYMTDIDRAENIRMRDTLIQFKAIDPGEELPMPVTWPREVEQ